MVCLLQLKIAYACCTGWELQQQLLAAAQPALAGLGDRAGAVAAVMARYNAQVLPAGNASMLDACLARLIR